ncbi:hypothetical protein RHGRI_035722 [Rhododendron griersonianum]|uniref:Mitochondrial phosphate carrier protein n=1 Tax=Rhododendron griersonianum TaxID=479676 RepID=A0AAV6HN73_9ERIC|nr:hypothetical protein RHGRI_035722 [Rhododendron griersonianum]
MFFLRASRLTHALFHEIDPSKYKSISSGFRVLLKEQGVRGLFRGWAPTLVGYSAQGACKFGFYEYFKKYYSDIAGPEYVSKYKTLIYLAASASAEFIADIALCPFEAVKVRVQTQPGFARGLSDGFLSLLNLKAFLDTMMKFASFETIVEMLYKYAIPTPKNECSKPLQLAVSFAGVFCAIVSHPADNLVSFLNSAKGATVGDVRDIFQYICENLALPFTVATSVPQNRIGREKESPDVKSRDFEFREGNFIISLPPYADSHPCIKPLYAVKQLGLWGLFTRGLPLRIVMIGTLTGAQWGIYDAFKVFVGLPTTGGVAPAPAAAKAATELA